MISAPAGYGKTTLLSQWAAVEDRPFAWLTVTEGDNDLTVLVAYLIRALDGIDPLPPEALAAFAASGADGPTVLLPRLGRMLLERSRPFVLALDDVHVLTDPDCLSALGVLVSHLPEGSQLALVDPPGSAAGAGPAAGPPDADGAPGRGPDAHGPGGRSRAARRRARSSTTRPRTRSSHAPRAGPRASTSRRSRREDLPDAEAVAARFAGDHRLVAEYLRDELIEALPDDVVEFLTRTSVLEYLDGPGCDAVLERSGSWAVLEELARSNLFVVPLDDDGGAVPLPPPLRGPAPGRAPAPRAGARTRSSTRAQPSSSRRGASSTSRSHHAGLGG